MKNKKLFAILTLVCFMFTLMPVAAFAAADAPAAPATTDYVGVKETAKDSVSVNVGGTVDAAVFNSAGTLVTDAAFFWAEDADENVVALGTDNSIKFNEAGTFYVFAAFDLPEGVITDSMTKAAAVNLVKDRYASLIVDDCLTVKVKKADTVYSFAPVADVTVTANDNWTEVETTVKLNKNGSTPVKNADINFTADSAYVTVEKVDRSTTDRNGEQVIRITAAKSGEYVVYADYEDAETLEIAINVLPDRIANIKTIAEPAKGVALDSRFDRGEGLSDIAFEITTVDGTKVTSGLNLDNPETPAVDEANYKITVVEAPADSNIDAEALALNYDADNDRWLLKGATSLDEEGTYTFKVALKNGGSATATVKVVKFVKPVMMSLTMNEKTVSLVGGEAATVKAVVFIDANGTVLSAAHNDYTKYAGARIMDGATVLGYAGIDYAGTGKALADVDAVTGAVDTVAYNSETKALVGSKVTIVAVCDKLEMTASADLTVVNKAAGLKYQSTTADIAVNNELFVNTVDEDGNVVAAGLDASTTASVYVLSAPANAAYSVNIDVEDSDELVVTFTASAAGEYKLQTIVRNDGKYYSSVDTIVVGGTVNQFEDVVVMSIGSNKIVVNSDVATIDAAPIVENGRTFVPFRALAEAFGAEVSYDEATQSVVAELNGVKVVMTIGSATYTVDGAAKTADVAPFINGSRTMVPVRFVAEAFGITVTPLYGENGATVDVLFAK